MDSFREIDSWDWMDNKKGLGQMEEVEAMRESAAKESGQLSEAEIEQQAEIILLKKQRTLEIFAYNNRFFLYLRVIYFIRKFSRKRFCFQQSRDFLLTEEFPAFMFALSEHPIPFPIDYRQWTISDPHIVSISLESKELPEHFSKRLPAALQVLDQ